MYDIRRWAEGLKYGLPKYTGLSTFFRQPFSPTLKGELPGGQAPAQWPQARQLPASSWAALRMPLCEGLAFG